MIAWVGRSSRTAANCAAPILTGVTVDGAHAEYVAVDAGGTVLLPDGISYEDAAPTLCHAKNVQDRAVPTAPR